VVAFSFFVLIMFCFTDGRLAMLGAAGFLAQELVNGKGILENFGIDAHAPQVYESLV